MNQLEMWNSFIGENKEYKDRKYDAWSFGYGEEMADRLGNLVLSGEKTGTASGYCFYELEKEEVPKVGEISIILNGREEALCIIETTKVYTLPFNEVTEDHAFKEGEGDKSLTYWRKVHKDFFSRELKEYSMEFEETMLVVCEEFKVIWK